MASNTFNLPRSSGSTYLVGMIKWNSTANTSGNYSSVTATLYVRKDNDGMILTVPTTGTWSYSLNINGNNISGTTYAGVLTDWVEIASHTVSRVDHDSDGGKVIAISGSVTAPSATSMAGRSTSGSNNVRLDTIPRASAVTATDANIGSNTIITIARAASGFTHTLTYAFGGLTGTIADKTPSTSIPWTVPTSFYDIIPGSPSGECVITCDTYNGATKIGTATCVFRAIADKAICSPVVSVSAVDVNSESTALTGNNKSIINGISRLRVVTSAEAKNGSSIASVSAYCGGNKQSGADVTFDGANSAAVYVIVTDSRGYQTRVDVDSLTLINYVTPTIIPNISRDSPTGDKVAVSVRGKWYNGSFGAATNTLKIKVRYKIASDANYGSFHDVPTTKNGNDYTATVNLSGVDYTKAYSFQLCLVDAIFDDAKGYRESKYATVPLSKGVPVFDWGEHDFCFNVPVNFNAGMNIAPENGVSVIGEGVGNMIPLTHIVEQGVIDSWTYRRWSDGMAELWGHITVTHANGSILGGELNYPFALTGNIYGIGTLNSAGGNSAAALPWNLKFVYSTVNCGAWVHNGGTVGFEANATADVSIYIVGRWKE